MRGRYSLLPESNSQLSAINSLIRPLLIPCYAPVNSLFHSAQTTTTSAETPVNTVVGSGTRFGRTKFP
jgi:hypothetical protein